jgi:hypothetical protein
MPRPGQLSEAEDSEGDFMSEPDHGHLPLRDYDHLSLSSLAARIRSLPAGQTTELLEYERAYAHRPQAVQILEHRRDELGRGAQPTPVTASPPPHGEPDQPARPKGNRHG